MIRNVRRGVKAQSRKNNVLVNDSYTHYPITATDRNPVRNLEKITRKSFRAASRLSKGSLPLRISWLLKPAKSGFGSERVPW